ncbi:hypothetical protein GCM10027435_04980 [Haloparvum alkalitolerans]|uniref:PadR family transcriptional regulator n=1 Tax=Haloparvum alkalitolerans TaxID=1042953 RepID=UPI003CF64742
MPRWLHSGRRRDICALVHEAGEIRAQALKSRLAEHADERVDPRTFRQTLDALENRGFLAARVDGIADVYRLTDEGEKRLLDHYEWLTERIENAAAED